MNHLADAASPYLRQHADNPVDWREWGDEVFARARAEDKPIFLSVGYSSCHWCHVMAHESFEDPETAEVLNERFVPVKVDREERPDVDSVYMSAVQAMTGHGGWPMSVFLTPDGVPFFAGTYWPKEERHGMPSFSRVLDAVSDAWGSQRDEVEASSEKIAEHLRRMEQLELTSEPVDAEVAERAASLCVRAWDSQHGGFGQAPKFPQAMTIDFLLASHQRSGDDGALRAATHSLEQMSKGGIYDHVGGGFARYSVDPIWLVPHFEKMLYDNALLLRAYTHAWQVTPQPRFRRIAAEVAEYLLRDMRHERGGFYSATDADSEGVEGKFFVWSAEEFRQVIETAGEDPDFWAGYYGITETGNFEGANILYEAAERDETDQAFSERVNRVRQTLFDRREQRVRPGLDDKILASWNGLALGALAEAGAVLSEPRFIDAARDCAEFLASELVLDGGMRHSWKDGHGAGDPVFAEDVAFVAQGLLTLYEADPDARWVQWARELAATAGADFADPDTPGTYFATPHHGEELLSRPRELFDNATPSPTSVMADVNLRLAALTGEPAYQRSAEATLSALAGRASQAPTGFGELLRALERTLQGPQEVAVIGDPGEPAVAAMASAYRETLRPGSVLAVGEPNGQAEVPLLAGRERVDGAPAAYVCRNFACERPVTDPAELRSALAR